MSVRRKKFIMPLLYRDATDQNRLKPLTSGEAVIFPGGATINDTVTLAGSGLAVDVHNPGELSAGDLVEIIDSDKTSLGTAAVNAVSFTTGTGDIVTLDSVSTGSTAAEEGQRIVLSPSLGTDAVLYAYEEGTTELTNPITLSATNNGMLEFYCEHETVDIYIQNSTQVDDGWGPLGVEAGSTAMSPPVFKVETMTEAAIMQPAMSTGCIVVDTAGTTMSQIEGCAEGKIILVVNKAGATISIATTVSEAQDNVQDSAGETIDIPDDSSILLVGATVGSSTMWARPSVTSSAFADLDDVSITTPTIGSCLYWTGSNWIDSAQIGNGAVTVLAAHLSAGSTRFYSGVGGNYIYFNVSALTGNIEVNWPNKGGAVMVTTADQDDTGQKTFRDNTATSGGLRLESSTGGFYFDFNTSAATANKTLTFPDDDVNLIHSQQKHYYEMYVATAGAGNAITSGTWDLDDTATWADGETDNIGWWGLLTGPGSTGGRITYLGADKTFKVTVTGSFSTASGGTAAVVTAGIALNGAAPTVKAQVKRYQDGSNDVGAWATQSVIPLTSGDYLEVQFNPAANRTVILQTCCVVFEELEID